MMKVDCAVGPPSFVGPKLQPGQYRPQLIHKGLEHVLVVEYTPYFYSPLGEIKAGSILYY